jgi:hypothetical protein
MKKLLVILFGLIASLPVQAEIYKHVDADGHVTYSNVPMKGATRLNLEPAVAGAPGGGNSRPRASATPTPANFPRVDQGTQKQRDGKRQDILAEELATERKALEDAKKNYSDGESNPETFKTKDGKTFRNVPKFEEKMQKLQEDVNLHQKNIELLEKELGTTK